MHICKMVNQLQAGKWVEEEEGVHNAKICMIYETTWAHKTKRRSKGFEGGKYKSRQSVGQAECTFDAEWYSEDKIY